MRRRQYTAQPQINLWTPRIICDDPAFKRLGDGARYITSVLSSRSLRQHRADDQFANLHSGILRRIIGSRAVTPALRYLIDSGAVETDRFWRAGHKSIGYRLSDAALRCQPVECRTHRISDAIQAARTRRLKSEGAIHHQLRRALSQISFDPEAGRAVLASLPDGRRRVIIAETLARIESGHHWYFSADRFGRVHTWVSGLPRELRSCLRSGDGSGLVSVDIANSQPLMLATLAVCWFQRRDIRRSVTTSQFHPFANPFRNRSLRRGRLSVARAINTYPPIYDAHLDDETPQKQGKAGHKRGRLETHSPAAGMSQAQLLASAIESLGTCEAGQFYESLPGGIDDREAAKKQAFRDWLYGDDRQSHSTFVAGCRAQHPALDEVLQNLKASHYSHAAHHLQNLEACFLIDGVARDYLVDGIRPLATIHDSLLVAEDGLDDARRGILDFARTCLGIRPALTIGRLGDLG